MCKPQIKEKNTDVAFEIASTSSSANDEVNYPTKCHAKKESCPNFAWNLSKFEWFNLSLFCIKVSQNPGFSDVFRGNRSELIQLSSLKFQVKMIHFVKSDRIWSYSDPCFSIFSPNPGKCGPE